MFDQNMTQNFDFDSTIMGNNNTIDNIAKIIDTGLFNLLLFFTFFPFTILSLNNLFFF